MRRVYFTWFVRRVMPLFVLEVGVFSAVFMSIQSYVSFGSVWNTAFVRATQHSVGSFGWYILASLSNTEFAAKVLALTGFAIIWLLTRDTLRISRQFRRNLMRVERVT